MKQVNLTINVSDSKFNQLLEFLTKNFGSVNVTEVEDFEIPEWHKEIVRERKKTSKPENFFALEDLDKKIKL
ncbi:MAG: hypothetical protein V4622_02385 [Bacteroidota bacterium]